MQYHQSSSRFLFDRIWLIDFGASSIYRYLSIDNNNWEHIGMRSGLVPLGNLWYMSINVHDGMIIAKIILSYLWSQVFLMRGWLFWQEMILRDEMISNVWHTLSSSWAKDACLGRRNTYVSRKLSNGFLFVLWSEISRKGLLSATFAKVIDAQIDLIWLVSLYFAIRF